MKKALTISVAAYNVEKYLDKLMQSLIASEVMDQLEILIVNDGSKDQTESKALQYQNLYPQSVRLINKGNGGHGSTINRGIIEATGKYFRALDGDDWVHSEHLKDLVSTIPDINADVILSDFCRCYETGEEVTEEFKMLEKGKTYSFDEIQDKVGWMRYHTVIYRTEMLQEHHICLDEHCFYVDTEFMLFPVPFVNSIYYSKDSIYCYRFGLAEQSVSAESRMKHIDNSLTVSKSLLNYYQKMENQLSVQKRQYYINGTTGHCIWYYESLLHFTDNKQRKEELREFDQFVKAHSMDVYNEMEKRSKKLMLIRKSNYLLYSVMQKYYVAKHNV